MIVELHEGDVARWPCGCSAAFRVGSAGHLAQFCSEHRAAHSFGRERADPPGTFRHPAPAPRSVVQRVGDALVNRLIFRGGKGK